MINKFKDFLNENADYTDDLKQYMTNLLYYAHIEAKDMSSDEFDKWAEEMIDGIDEFLKSQNKT